MGQRRLQHRQQALQTEREQELAQIAELTQQVAELTQQLASRTEREALVLQRASSEQASTAANSEREEAHNSSLLRRIARFGKNQLKNLLLWWLKDDIKALKNI